MSMRRAVSTKKVKLWSFVVLSLKNMCPKSYGKLFCSFWGDDCQISPEIDLDVKVDFLSRLSCNSFRRKLLKLWGSVVTSWTKMWPNIGQCCSVASAEMRDKNDPKSTYHLVCFKQKVEGSNPSRSTFFWNVAFWPIQLKLAVLTHHTNAHRTLLL